MENDHRSRVLREILRAIWCRILSLWLLSAILQWWNFQFDTFTIYILWREKRENFALLHVFRNLIWDCLCTIQYNKHFLSNFLLSYGHGYTESPKWNKKNKHGIKQDLEEDICDWKSEAGCWIADATIPPCSNFLSIWWHDLCNILCNTCWLPTST